MSLNRPEPVMATNVHALTAEVPVPQAVRWLEEGRTVEVVSSYGHGADVLDALYDRMSRPSGDYAQRTQAEQRFRSTAHKLVVRIDDHAVALPNVESIGFLSELYAELGTYHLPLIEVQSLHGAWRTYQAGVHLAVLGHRLHPYFGTYVPSRTTHLELFATWLSGFEGSRDVAVDVGTGSGVLAFMMARQGVGSVIATDVNANAAHSVRLDCGRLPELPAIDVRVGDLLEPVMETADLIVFNPPWTAGMPTGLVSQALTFPEGLFERFFDQALSRLAPDGRVVLVFSNLITLVQPDVPHPIEAELARGRFRLVNKLTRKVKPVPGPDGRKRRTKEKVEVWELARADGA